jgi:hypothetical protein
MRLLFRGHFACGHQVDKRRHDKDTRIQHQPPETAAVVGPACLSCGGTPGGRWLPADARQKPPHHPLVRVTLAPLKFILLDGVLSKDRRLFCCFAASPSEAPSIGE